MADPLDKPFFARASNGDETDCYATFEEARDAAFTLAMAPFTVMELRPYPIRGYATNGDAEFEQRRKAFAQSEETMRNLTT